MNVQVKKSATRNLFPWMKQDYERAQPTCVKFLFISRVGAESAFYLGTYVLHGSAVPCEG